MDSRFIDVTGEGLDRSLRVLVGRVTERSVRPSTDNDSNQDFRVLMRCQFLENVGRRLKIACQICAVLLDLLSRNGLRSKIQRGCGPDNDVGIGSMRKHGLTHLISRSDTYDFRKLKFGRSGYQYDTSAPISRSLRDRVTHFSRGPVADVTNR